VLRSCDLGLNTIPGQSEPNLGSTYGHRFRASNALLPVVPSALPAFAWEDVTATVPSTIAPVRRNASLRIITPLGVSGVPIGLSGIMV
jgi:hypothetical protein